MLEAVVLGRVGVDLTPPAPRTTLAEAASFVRAVGGYGGNVATGLARLGVSTAIVSAVGDDGLGENVRLALVREGVEVSRLARRAGMTQLAFFEAWPPDRFPVTFHRSEPAPETLASTDEIVAGMAMAPLAVVSAALLARDPARTSLLRALERRTAAAAEGWTTVLDVDWRPTLWPDPTEAPALVRRAAAVSDVVIASDEELAASALTADDLLAIGVRIVAVKHGPAGSSAITRDARVDVPGVPVGVVCGLGSGDAFAAAFVAALLANEPLASGLARANAAGAIVASRLMCSSAMPTPAEIDAVLADQHTDPARARTTEAIP